MTIPRVHDHPEGIDLNDFKDFKEVAA